MEITGIRLTNASAYVIIFRNKDNSSFYIRPKSDFERELELIEANEDEEVRPIVTSTTEGWKFETTIITMIGKGIKFYTYNFENKTFTEVTVVDGNIKSIANETDNDNISNLPLG
jgi:hypothetical protein